MRNFPTTMSHSGHSASESLTALEKRQKIQSLRDVIPACSLQNINIGTRELEPGDWCTDPGDFWDHKGNMKVGYSPRACSYVLL